MSKPTSTQHPHGAAIGALVGEAFKTTKENILPAARRSSLKVGDRVYHRERPALGEGQVIEAETPLCGLGEFLVKWSLADALTGQFQMISQAKNLRRIPTGDEVRAKDGVAVECDNCGWKGDSADLGEYRDVHERVAPGEIMPAGECPECQCSAHLVEALAKHRASDLKAAIPEAMLKLRKAQEALDKVIRYQDPPLDIGDILELRQTAATRIDEAMATIDRATGGEFRLNEYLENRSYGGPEEGGWYYTTGEFVKCHGRYATFEEAEAAQNALDGYLDEKRAGQHRPGSIQCSGWSSLTIEAHHGADFPKEKPYYS